MNTTQEPKYKIENGKLHNRQSGQQIPDDEPVMIFRARDKAALAAIRHYHSRVLNNEHARAVYLRIGQFEKWAIDHPDRMKEPDTQLTGHEADWGG